MSYQFEHVAKDFQLGSLTVPALKEVSFVLKPGEFAALQGPSGSGKSTILNILGLIDRPSRGKVLFDGVSVGELNEEELTDLRQKHIGFIFQNFNLVPVLTALENVEYALFLEQKWSRSKVRSLALGCLQQVGLELFAHHKPAQLSGGQRQRVAIARALVKEPKLIIADEPTANLDSQTALQILSLIKDLKQRLKTSIVVATHDPIVASMAERLLRVKDGVME